MPTSGRTTFNWTIEFTPPAGVGSTIIFESGSQHAVRPSTFTWIQRDDVAASELRIRFPSATQFFNLWLDYNPLTIGSTVVLKVDGYTRFTGKVKEFNPKYSADDRSLAIICRDKMDVKDATVDINIRRRTIYEVINLTRKEPGSSLWFSWTSDITPARIRPWAEEFIIPVWIGDPTDADNPSCRLQLSEYEILYEVGGISFREATVRCVGDTDADQQALDDIEDDVYAGVVYYDDTDDSTMISNLLRLAFENDEASGGLAWTEGVDYAITDETTADIMSGMEWITDEGDGDLQSFLSNLYDNPKIGLSPSYWMRDFNGDGQVTAKLVAQDNDNSIDIDIIYDAQLPNPFTSIYSRAVLVNNESTRRNLMRDATITNEFPFGDFPIGDVPSVTETGKHPNSSAVDEENLQDGTSATSWGYFAIGNKGDYDLDMKLPADLVLFSVNFGEEKDIDSIYYNCRYTFNGGDDSQPILHDTTTKQEAYNGLYKIHENQRITVEHKVGDDWFPLHHDLYLSEVDILDARNGWKKVEGINKKAQYLRVVINNPVFGKVSETNWTNKAFRVLLWFMSEFIVLERGRVLEDGGLPEVTFTDNPADPERCMYDLTDTYVDMYRPTLMAYLEATGLKYKTLVIESDDVWDFSTKIDADPDEVGLGYKYLVTRLDAASKENEWTVRIDPRPDIRIGHTVHSSRLDPDKHFLVHQSTIENVSGRMSHVLVLSDHENVDGDEPSGYCDE